MARGSGPAEAEAEEVAEAEAEVAEEAEEAAGAEAEAAGVVAVEVVAAAEVEEAQAAAVGRVIRAATAAVRRPEPTDERHDELERILVPPGRPKRGRSVKFHCEILKAAREFEQRSLSPAKEIARRKKVSENLVYQWLHVAREHARLGRCDG